MAWVLKRGRAFSIAFFETSVVRSIGMNNDLDEADMYETVGPFLRFMRRNQVTRSMKMIWRKKFGASVLTKSQT